MRRMFSWKRRFNPGGEFAEGFWRGGIGGNYKLHLTILHLSRGDLQCDHDGSTSGPGGLSGRTQPAIADAAENAAPVMAENDGVRMAAMLINVRSPRFELSDCRLKLMLISTEFSDAPSKKDPQGRSNAAC